MYPTALSSESTLTPFQMIYGTLFATGIGALCSPLIALSPLGGAIFGASFLLGNRLTHWICQESNCCPNSLIARMATVGLCILGGAAFAATVTSLMGFTITIGMGICLTAAMSAVTIAALLVLSGCLISSIFMTGIWMHSRENSTSNRL